MTSAFIPQLESRPIDWRTGDDFSLLIRNGTSQPLPLLRQIGFLNPEPPRMDYRSIASPLRLAGLKTLKKGSYEAWETAPDLLADCCQRVVACHVTFCECEVRAKTAWARGLYVSYSGFS